MSSSLIRTLAVGAVAGYLAGRAMDQATTWFLKQQSERSRQREQALAAGGALGQGGKTIAGWLGYELTDEQAAQVGSVVHKSLGAAYGMAAALLAREGKNPLQAGLMTGAGAFLLVDEGLNSVAFTPPPWEYPVESHLRGVVGHLTFGAVLGGLLAVARQSGMLRR